MVWAKKDTFFFHHHISIYIYIYIYIYKLSGCLTKTYPPRQNTWCILPVLWRSKQIGFKDIMTKTQISYLRYWYETSLCYVEISPSSWCIWIFSFHKINYNFLVSRQLYVETGRWWQPSIHCDPLPDLSHSKSVPSCFPVDYLVYCW